MNQAIQLVVPAASSASALEGSASVSRSKEVQVCWLPSVPLTKKHKVPPISGLGILYSEELDRVLSVFETDNLKEGVKKFTREQAAALNIDPGCRLHWLEVANPIHRSESTLKLTAQMQS